MMTERSDRARLVVEDCVEYWRRTGVPRSTVAGMREELERHLRDAVEEGRSVESVTGPDVLGFAEEWAREFRPAAAIPRRGEGRGPAFLALGAAILSLFGFLAMGAFAGGGATIEVCCPRQVIESGTTVVETGLLLWAGLILMVGVMGIVGAVFLFRGRLRLGGGIALAAAPVALLTMQFFASGLLFGAAVWAFVRARRAEAPVVTP